jgi:hypothetical protein
VVAYAPLVRVVLMRPAPSLAARIDLLAGRQRDWHRSSSACSLWLAVSSATADLTEESHSSALRAPLPGIAAPAPLADLWQLSRVVPVIPVSLDNSATDRFCGGIILLNPEIFSSFECLDMFRHLLPPACFSVTANGDNYSDTGQRERHSSGCGAGIS